ncbi:MAG: hypothetical protein V4692_03585, partial [Bdellovibrionota bacterium]
MRFSSRVLSILLVILQIVFLVPFANAETHSLSECITSDGKTTEVFKLRLARVQRLNGCRQSKSLASCEKELWIGSGALAAAAATSGALVGIGKIRNTKSSFCKAVTWIPGRSENIWSIASFDSALMHLFSSETVYANSCQIRAPDLWQKHRRLMQASIRTLDRDLDTARQNQQVLESELARRGAPRTYESIIDQHPDVYNAEVDANNAYGDAQDELKEATARGKGKYTEEMKQWRETVATKREVWVNSRRRLDKLLSAKMGNPTAIPQNVRDELNKGITAAKADVERLSAARAKYSELSLQAAKANQ